MAVAIEDLKEYRCDVCDADSVKLWRNNGLGHPSLFCAICAADGQGVDIGGIDAKGLYTDESGDSTCHIGDLSPAYPMEDGVSFWGSSQVPQEVEAWWRALPTCD